jgi:hypothetical protein
MQRVNVLLLDDLVLYQTEGKEEEPATETVEFGLHGKHYRIDLNNNNAAELESLLEPYIQAASQKLGRGTARRSRTVASRNRSADIRAWASENGYQVSDRGRIPAEVVAEYDAAH